MMSVVRPLFAAFVCALSAQSLFAKTLLDDMPAGTGFSAQELCSRTRVTGSPYQLVKDKYISPKVFPLPYLWAIEEGKNSITVRTKIPGLQHPRTAIFRSGLGCTLIPPGVDINAVMAQSFTPVTPPPASTAAWPMGEAIAQNQSATPSERVIIQKHAAQIFSEPHSAANRQLNATALLLARDGKLIHEQYASGYGRENLQLGWSMTKTLTTLAAGVLEQNGKIQLDAPMGMNAWKNTPKSAITWRQMMNMAPGLDWFEDYKGASDTTDMLYSAADQGAWAAQRPLVVKPGTVFNYSTGFSNLVMYRMKEMLGGTHQAIYNHYQNQLLLPLGVRGAIIEPDSAGTPIGGARGFLRPVDWLRLGQLMANNGQWNGKTILTPSFAQFVMTPSPASDTYGGTVWRLPYIAVLPELRARLPEETFFFAGHMGQFVVVVPSKNIVLLRMGVSHGTEYGVVGGDPALTQTLSLLADFIAAK